MIEIYSMDNCPFCEKALKLMDDNKITYTYLKLGSDFSKEHLANRLGVDTTTKITLPQIFIDNVSIGGYSELKNCFSAVLLMKHLGVDHDDT